MVPQTLLTQLTRFFRHNPNTAGCLIGFEGNNTSRVLYEGNRLTGNYHSTMIVIEAIESRQPPGFNIQLQSDAEVPAYLRNRSRLLPEVLGAGANCAFTAVAAGAMIAAAPLLATPLGIIVILALVTNFQVNLLQCGIGAFRLSEIIRAPDENSLQRMDSNPSYQTATTTLSAIDVGTSLGAGAMTAFAERAMQTSLRTLLRTRLFTNTTNAGLVTNSLPSSVAGPNSGVINTYVTGQVPVINNMSLYMGTSSNVEHTVFIHFIDIHTQRRTTFAQ
jgi:hypothetical protein